MSMLAVISGIAVAAALAIVQTPAPTDTQAARVFAADYLKMKDAGRYSEAFALQDASLRTLEPLDFFSATDRDTAGRLGALKTRELVRVSWFRDPAGLPEGAYASVDVKSVFEKVDLHCGFIYLRWMPDGRFLVVREHWAYIDKKTAASLETNNQLAPAWELLGRNCRAT